MAFCFAVSMAFISLGYNFTVYGLRSLYGRAMACAGCALLPQICAVVSCGVVYARSAVFCSVGAELLDYANKTP